MTSLTPTKTFMAMRKGFRTKVLMWSMMPRWQWMHSQLQVWPSQSLMQQVYPFPTTSLNKTWTTYNWEWEHGQMTVPKTEDWFNFKWLESGFCQNPIPSGPARASRIKRKDSDTRMVAIYTWFLWNRHQVFACARDGARLVISKASVLSSELTLNQLNSGPWKSSKRKKVLSLGQKMFWKEAGRYERKENLWRNHSIISGITEMKRNDEQENDTWICLWTSMLRMTHKS